MSQKAIILTVFWVFIGVMVLKQARDYNNSVSDKAKGAPAHFFYDMPHPDSGSTARSTGLTAAKVIQQSYWVTTDSSSGMFSCHSVLKNVGNGKAVGIELKVRPYRGTHMRARGTEREGPLSDYDAMSQINELVTAPDLGPGESTTQTVSFPVRPLIDPGSNPNPEIIFQTDKNP